MKLAIGILPLIVLAAACGPASLPASRTAEAWNARNDPLRLGGAFNLTLAELPLEGELVTTPWSDTYWPSYQGGIAARWRADVDNFTYTPPTQAEFEAMTLAERARLSPAEKFDALIGRFDYPLVTRERQRTSPNNATWEGICHGWSPAAINFDEPHPVLATSASGLEIPFGSSDVKALLSYYEGEISDAKSIMLGNRCNADFETHPEAANDPACRDTNAGAFHVVVANQLGLLGKGFVADVTRDAQVWNQPVHGFTSTVIGEQAPSTGAAAGTVKEVMIRTKMRYTVEIYPTWDAVNGTTRHADDTAVYEYRLELDANGRVIGGEWTSDARPDFLWTEMKPEFTGYFKDLQGLYELSRTAASLPDPL